ncbi:MAG: segregation/condensation protein A [Deltaproteobacteria bacterium]|nr:segregation/condensation protein A [Deltaproteobacteria bacterium]MBN2688478.1 segregation/condensation protein A [Deltaproteobacteria bacterium]
MSYEIKLDIFQGPLDLLLYLIKKNEIDIYNIPIALVTKQYLEYLDLMKAMNLDVAGEYLVMASALIHIKSRMLLPVHEDEEEPVDPRDELTRQLLEYQTFKAAALKLEAMNILGRDVFRRPEPGEDDRDDDNRPLEEVNIFQLVEAFRQIVSSMVAGELMEIDSERMSLSDRINEIMEQLTKEKVLTFLELLGDTNDRLKVIYTFLALLELMKLRVIKAYQAEQFGTIRIYLAVEE